MSNTHILIAPMRVQPLHFGHEYYIRQLAETGDRVIILLNQKQDFDNPFSFVVRQKWIRDFLSDNNIKHVIVPERFSQKKEIEYPLHADNKHFTVVTTNETDDTYRELCFRTLNHHATQLAEPAGAALLPGYNIPIANTGRLIRDMLRRELPCHHLLSGNVEREARTLINST